MLSSTTSMRRLAAPAALAALLVSGAGCPRPGEPPSTGAGGPAGGGDVRMTLTVNPADPQGKRTASVKFEADAPMKDGQLTFELPAQCQVTAGAAVRPVRNIGPAKSVSQELAFQCAAGTTGALRAKFVGQDAAGKPIEKTAEGSL